MQSDTMGPPTNRDLLSEGLLFGLALPFLALGGLYLGSLAAGVVFGNVIFVLTIVMGVLWFVAVGWGRQTVAANPINEVLFGSGSRFVRERGTDSTDSGLPFGTRALVVLTGAVLWGWLFLLVEYAAFG